MSSEKAKKKTTEKNTKSTNKTTSKKTVAENVVGKGSLLYVDYIIKTKRDGKVFDCTMEDVARKEGI